MRETTRGRWELAAEIVVSAGLCLLLVYEARHTPVELAGGLVAVVLSLALIRVAPVVALAVACATSAAMLFDFGGRIPMWPILLMISTGFLTGRRLAEIRPALLVFGATVLSGLPVSLLFSELPVADWAVMTAVLACSAVVPWLLGRYFRLREELLRSGWERADELRAQQRVVTEQARLRERARIAADMHDSLGHELSLLALRAGALEMAADLSDRRREEVADLRRSAAVATERLHEIIGVLRADATAAPMEPPGETVEELVSRARESGLLIELYKMDGSVPSMVDRAVHRVVQEGLTNVAKHAPGAAATVRIEHTADRTTVTVTNEPPPAGPLPTQSGGQRGLTGLRERVRLVGGTFTAGPKGDGFEVCAVLPHDAAPAAVDPVDVEQAEAVRALDLGRRKANRTLLIAVGGPLTALAFASSLSVIFYTYDWINAKLDQRTYEQLTVGQLRSDLVAVLPRQQKEYRAQLPEPPVPDGAACAYYGTDENLLAFSNNVYRLCFRDGRLAAKDLIIDTRDEN